MPPEPGVHLITRLSAADLFQKDKARGPAFYRGAAGHEAVTSPDAFGGGLTLQCNNKEECQDCQIVWLAILALGFSMGSALGFAQKF